jgi:hypothetical protein
LPADDTDSASGAALASRYEFTPTEALVLQLLAGGKGAKTGMRRQADLTRLFASTRAL